VLLDVSAVPREPVGAGVYTVALAHGLAARPDVDLVLLSRSNDGPRWSAIAPDAQVVARVPATRPLRLAWEQVVAPSLAVRLGIDVWHGPHYTMPVRLTVPSVVTVHDLTFIEHPEWHERSKLAFFPRIIVASVNRANVCLCVSEHTASRLVVHTKPVGRIRVVHHGVDHSTFSPIGDAERDHALLARHGIAEPYVAFLSTIEPRKNVAGLVAAFARVAPQHPELRLVLAGGDGWGIEAVRDAIRRSGVATRIVRPGRLPDAVIPAFYRRAAVVAYPSFAEGFGLPALEALACGAPLVTSRGTSLDEVVGDAAITVAPDDTRAIAAGLEQALDPSTAARLRRAGPDQAAKFTWERSIAGHVEAYELATDRAGVR
jgi:glycosyltransferase involved in cell wall biosynthesis